MKTLRKKLSTFSKRHPRRAKAIPTVLIAVIGIGTLLISQAATFSVALEPELASAKTGVTTPTSDSTASGNSYVQFGTQVVDPNPSAKPTASNTGWQYTGVTLTDSSSNTISQSGVVDGKRFNGCVTVTASNVTIKRSQINCGSGAGGLRNSGSNLLIEDTEIIGGRDYGCLSGGNWTARRVNLYGCQDVVRPGSNVTLENSYIHDMRDFDKSDGGASDCYCDMFQTFGGISGVTIRSNHFNARTSDLSILQFGTESSGTSNFLIEGNWFNGARNSIYGGSPPGYTSTNMRYINNRFGRNAGGARFLGDAVWTGNVWDDTGAVYPKPSN